jgi:uncharacterized damage-inducible protein DinB
MELRDHARHTLDFSRRFTEGLLASFKTPEDWVFQLHPKANHALWVAGHLPLADNSILSRFRPNLAAKPEGWDAVFGRGSQPQPDAAAYPPTEKVLEYFRERRQTLLAVLDELSEEEMRSPAPPVGERSPIAGAPSLGHAFIFLAFHEGMHAGQVSVAHRALGHAPLVG